MDKVFRGVKTSTKYVVTENNQPLTSPHINNHSEFEWGTNSHGSRHLAQTLLFSIQHPHVNADDLVAKISETILAGLGDTWEFAESELKALVDMITFKK